MNFKSWNLNISSNFEIFDRLYNSLVHIKGILLSTYITLSIERYDLLGNVMTRFFVLKGTPPQTTKALDSFDKDNA
jgi:hypothetical protein